MDNLIHKPENPAKTFLRRYRALVARQESLQRSIDAAYDRAYSCTARLKPVTVTGGNGAFDRMAEDVAKIADETEQLQEAKARVDEALAEILRAIEAVPDEMQKAVLTLRYVEGLDWISISERIQYEAVECAAMAGKCAGKCSCQGSIIIASKSAQTRRFFACAPERKKRSPRKGLSCFSVLPSLEGCPSIPPLTESRPFRRSCHRCAGIRNRPGTFPRRRRFPPCAAPQGLQAFSRPLTSAYFLHSAGA